MLTHGGSGGRVEWPEIQRQILTSTLSKYLRRLRSLWSRLSSGLSLAAHGAAPQLERWFSPDRD